VIKIESFRGKTRLDLLRAIVASEDYPDITNQEQADAVARKLVPHESYYQAKVIDRVKKLRPKAFVWKVAQGPYSRVGVPDVCACIDGVFYGFEVKRPFFGQTTKAQEKCIRDIIEAGGRAYVVSYPEDVDAVLGKEG
jgi:hypothetical protein